MNNRQPRLRKHVSGQWFCHWGGKDYYFGHNLKQAQKDYRASMLDRAKWIVEKYGPIEKKRASKAVTVLDLCEKFLGAKRLERSAYTVNHLHYALRQFVAIHAADRAAAIRPMTIAAYRADLSRAGLAARTINHYVAAVKEMFKWGAEMELIPAIALSVIKPFKLPPPKPKGHDVNIVLKMIGANDQDVSSWVRLHWLTIMRPAEVVRVVNRHGEFVEPWLFRPDQAKTGGRMIVFSDSALKALAKCAPRWKSLSGYGHSVKDETGYAPHPLRHGGASYLLQSGVDRATVDLLLGHSLPRVSLIYAPVNYNTLRASAEILARPLSPQSVCVS